MFLNFEVPHFYRSFPPLFFHMRPVAFTVSHMDLWVEEEAKVRKQSFYFVVGKRRWKEK